MAEADAFISAALRQNGWLEEESTWTVAALSSDALIVIVLKFLARWQDTNDNVSFNLPCVEAKAPVGVVARHRVGSHLATILKELGYAEDCGFNHFLYPNEKETRNLLSWLVGKLPRSKLEEHEDESSKTEALSTIAYSADSVLEPKQLANIFSSWKREKTLHMLPNPNVKGLRGFQRLPLKTFPLKLPWTRSNQSTHSSFDGFPVHGLKPASILEALAVSKRGSAMLQEDKIEEETDLKGQLINGQIGKVLTTSQRDEVAGQDTEANANNDVKAISSQASVVKERVDVPLTPEVHVVGTGEKSSIQSIGLASMKASPSGEDVVVKFDDRAENDMIQKQVEKTKRRLAAMRKVVDREHCELHEVAQRVIKTQSTHQEMQQQLTRQKQLVALLPEANANIAKLDNYCRANAEKKVEIAQQMESARAALLQEYQKLHGQRSGRKARYRQLIREIKAFRTELVDLTGEIHSKRERLRALEKVHVQQLATLGKQKDAMTRNVYISRIMAIIKQVHKQKQDIAKVLDDINGLQKEVKTASEKLKQTEAVAEEKLNTAASKSKTTSCSKDTAYIECYRKFAQVRELFKALLLIIGEAGEKENIARDVQNQILHLEARSSASHLDKVLGDLQSVRLENDTLRNELRARDSKH